MKSLRAKMAMEVTERGIDYSAVCSENCAMSFGEGTFSTSLWHVENSHELGGC
jgi:hypothetical protein